MILALYGSRRDITLNGLRRDLGHAGVTVAIPTLHRFFALHGITHKTTGHAVEQDRADVLSTRQEQFDWSA